MFTLGLEKAEETQRSNCQHPLDHRKSKRIPEKNIYFCIIDYAKAFDCVEHNKLWKILQKMELADHLSCLPTNLYAGQEATVRTRHGTTIWFQIGKWVHHSCILSPCLFNLYAEYVKCQAGWSTSWNQYFQEKYQEPQICKWHHPYARKWRGTKEPLDESEIGQWKSWLKTQHSEN